MLPVIVTALFLLLYRWLLQICEAVVARLERDGVGCIHMHSVLWIPVISEHSNGSRDGSDAVNIGQGRRARHRITLQTDPVFTVDLFVMSLTCPCDIAVIAAGEL